MSEGLNNVFCINCGKKHFFGTRYCSKCGRMLPTAILIPKVKEEKVVMTIREDIKEDITAEIEEKNTWEETIATWEKEESTIEVELEQVINETKLSEEQLPDESRVSDKTLGDRLKTLVNSIKKKKV